MTEMGDLIENSILFHYEPVRCDYQRKIYEKDAIEMTKGPANSGGNI